MNEEAMKNLQGLLDNLSKDTESVGLKNEIAELESRLANPDYYKTPNKADGTPAQTGDFGREYRNFSSHINSVNESLRNLVNKKISEISARQAELDNAFEQTATQAQLTGDENLIAEIEQEAAANRAILNNLTELANKQDGLLDGANQAQLANDATMEEINRQIEENQRALDEAMMGFEDSEDKAEYQRLLNDRAEEIKEHEDFLARAEALQAKDENGNPYLDKNGNPVVNVNLYNMISDEKKLAKAKEAYANTNLGMLESFVNAMNVKTETVAPNVESITDETKEEVDDIDLSDSQTPVTGIIESAPVEGVTDEKVEDNTSEEEKAAQEKLEQEAKEQAGIDAKIEADRKANLKAMFENEDKTKSAMDGSALDRLETDGIYIPSSIKPVETPVIDDVDDMIIDMPEKVEAEEVDAALAANDVGTRGGEVIATVKAEEIGSEEDKMAKKNKGVEVASYTEASEEQKKQSKGKLSVVKKLIVVGGFVATFAASIWGLNKLTSDNAEPTQVETEVETPEDEINIPMGEKHDGPGYFEDKGPRDTTPSPAPSATPAPAPVVTPAPSTTPLPDAITPIGQQMVNSLYPDSLGQINGNMIAFEERVVDEASQQEIAAAQADINNGVNVGDVLAGTGQTVLAVDTQINHAGPGYTDAVTVTTEEVSNNVVTPEGVNTPAPTPTPVATVEPSPSATPTDTAVLNPGETMTFDDGTTYTNNSNATENIEVYENEVLPEGLGIDFSAADIQAYDDTYFTANTEENVETNEESHTHSM